MTYFAHLPLSVVQQIERVSTLLVQVLGSHTAVVVHGSIALADFHLGHSDLDMLAFVETADGAQLRAVAHIMLAESGQPAPIEFSLVPYAALTPWVHPAPYLFHYSESWRVRTQQLLADPQHDWLAVRTDPDLTAHMVVAHRAGMVTAGQVELPLPSRADALAAVWYDIADAVNQVVDEPVYVILNLCRTACWLRDGVVRSKSAGGRALLPTLTGEAYDVVAAMLALRYGDAVPMPDAATLQR
ncbi:MAG: aminoglycoside adenylyltransferase domain-containing protein, partial [Roseiflexaceae bacterium]